VSDPQCLEQQSLVGVRVELERNADFTAERQQAHAEPGATAVTTVLHGTIEVQRLSQLRHERRQLDKFAGIDTS